jgi:hypothetical protein
MLLGVTLVSGMLIAWLAMTAVVIVLAVWRAVVALREEDQLFIDPGEEHLAREQQEIVAKLERIRPWLVWTFAASVVLGLATFGVWVYQSLQ